jgi:2-isopropylmalate synthase
MTTNGRLEVLEPSLREGTPGKDVSFAPDDNPKCLKRLEDAGARQRFPGGDPTDPAFLWKKLRSFGLEVDTEAMAGVRRKVEALLRQGWQFDNAEASLLLLALKQLKRYRAWFDLERYSVLTRGGRYQPDDDLAPDDTEPSEASVKLKVNGEVRHTVREGKGPVHALELALRDALRPTYPRLDEVALGDCVVRVMDSKDGTAARVRVLFQSRDRVYDQGWGSVGVSTNVVKASWLALVDALEFKCWLDTRDF